MNDPYSERNAPASTSSGEPAPAHRAVTVSLPSIPPTVTYILIGFTVFVYLLQMASMAIFQADLPIYYGARINAAIRAGEWWRFITPVFLHGSAGHIFFNMYALFAIGGFLERNLGHGRFILLYFLGAFSGNVFSFLLTEGYSVGASTAVFGLIGAQLLFFYQNRELFGGYARQAIGNTLFIIAINLFIGLSPGIDNWGHVGGLLGGTMFAWFAGTRWALAGIPPEMTLVDERESREVFTGAAAVALLFGLLAAWGLFNR